MTRGWVELSGESAELGRAEVAGAVEALGGERIPDAPSEPTPLVAVEVAREGDLERLAARLALARRTLVSLGEGTAMVERASREGWDGRTASIRPLGRPGGQATATMRRLGRAYTEGGGRIDLSAPQRRYWLALGADGRERLFREVGAVDRKSTTHRAMPRLPFQRPISLHPRLARAAANLAGTRPGDRILDPFLGTGALLAESALLGARVWGIDTDAAMIRGSLRNFEQLGVRVEAVVQGDAREVDLPAGATPLDAIVTDPPYGRASASVGAEPSQLIPEVVGRWAELVRPGGRVVVVCAGGAPVLGPPWVETVRVPVRVHRSLTREFCVYRRRS